MIQPFIDQASRELAEELKKHHSMDDEQADEVGYAVGKSFVELVKEQVDKGDYSVINETLSGEPTDISHQAVQQLIDPITKKVEHRSDLNETDSRKVVITLLPYMFNMLNEQVVDAKAKGIDLKELVQNLAAGNFGFALNNMGALMELGKGFLKGKSGGFNDFFNK